jgi:hypothetical protein
MEGVRDHLLWLVARTRSTNLTNNILDEAEFKELKEDMGESVKSMATDFVWLLFFIAIRSASEPSKTWCKKLAGIYFTNFTKAVKQVRMNLLLMAYQIGLTSSSEFGHAFDTKNRFYNELVLQCAFKIEYIYEELAGRFEHIDLVPKSRTPRGRKDGVSGGSMTTMGTDMGMGMGMDMGMDMGIETQSRGHSDGPSYYEQMLFSAPTRDDDAIEHSKRIIGAHRMKMIRGDVGKKQILLTTTKNINAKS